MYYVKSPTLRISFAEALRGVPELVYIACMDVQFKDLEDTTIFQIGSVAGINIRLIWRDLSELEDEVALRRGDGSCPFLFNLATVVLVTTVPLQVLRILFVVEYTTPDLLANLAVTDIRQDIWHHYFIVYGTILILSEKYLGSAGGTL